WPLFFPQKRLNAEAAVVAQWTQRIFLVRFAHLIPLFRDLCALAAQAPAKRVLRVLCVKPFSYLNIHPGKCEKRRMERIASTPQLSIDESEIDESFILASAQGGQNVNKVERGVQLRCDEAQSPSL